MKKVKKITKKNKNLEDLNLNNYPDDTIHHIKTENNEQPEIYKISKRNTYLNRKEFLKTAVTLTSFAAIGLLLKGCTKESKLQITSNGNNCTCDVVCTCNIVEPWHAEQGASKRVGKAFTSIYNSKRECTCDAVCTCDSVCSCDTVCACDGENSGGGGGSYSYWYPN